MKALFVLNDPPYETERVYNALRVAYALTKKNPATEVTLFLIADAALTAEGSQKMPDGFYNVERMRKRVLPTKGSVLLCGTCMDAQGMTDTEIMDGPRRSTMDELAEVTVEADKILVL